jgi:hypothetical protein
MNYRGDVYSGCTIGGSFTTVTTTGAPTQLIGTAGALCIVAYKLDPGLATGFQCSSAGITMAVSCGGRTGWNTWSVNTNSSPTFYSCGHDFELVLNHGTVGGTCVSGYLVASFSLVNRAGLNPYVFGRSIDVTATGHAGINWANVLNCTNATALTCTTVYDVVKAATLTDLACATIWSVEYSVEKVIDPINASSVVASVSGAVGSVTGGVTVTTNNDKTGYSLSAAGIACVTSAPIHEPANVPGWPMSVCTALGWVASLASNCVTQTASHQSLCNRALSSTIASARLTCSTTIVHRGTFGAVIP